jgi:hypothetical protein
MTVKQLVELLRTHDGDAQVVSTGADSGGYDYVMTDHIIVLATRGKVYVGGLHETGDMYRKAFE